MVVMISVPGLILGVDVLQEKKIFQSIIEPNVRVVTASYLGIDVGDTLFEGE